MKKYTQLSNFILLLIFLFLYSCETTGRYGYDSYENYTLPEPTLKKEILPNGYIYYIKKTDGDLYLLFDKNKEFTQTFYFYLDNELFFGVLNNDRINIYDNNFQYTGIYFDYDGMAHKEYLPEQYTMDNLFLDEIKVYKTEYGFAELFPSNIIEYDAYSKQYKIYDTDYGLKNIFPKKIIEYNEISDEYEIYNTTYGIKDLTPSTIIENSSDGKETKIYGTTYGLKNLFPDCIIEYDEYSKNWKVYKTTYGIKDISPTYIIEYDEFSNEYKVYDAKYGIKGITPIKVIKAE